MSLADEFAEVEHARREPSAPKPTDAAITWDGTEGELSTGILTERPKTWDELIRHFGLDPDEVEVIEPVERRSWDAAIGNGEVRTFHYFKAKLRRRREHAPDIEQLVDDIRNRPPPFDVEPIPSGGGTFLVGFADWQIGKYGSAAAIQRIADHIDDQVRRLKALRTLGRRISDVALPNLGDLGERCDGHYDMQAFSTELDGREQRRVGRQLIKYGVDSFLPYCEQLVMPAVGGNHGEDRKDGKAFTSFGDNFDVELYEVMAEVTSQSPAYDKVRWIVPKYDLAITVELSGVITAFAHGHQARKGTDPVGTWWAGQAMGMRPAGDAKLLLTGHRHQLSIREHGPRTHIQFPTEDSGSQWWDESEGTPTLPGMVSMLIGTEYSRGYGDLWLP